MRADSPRAPRNEPPRPIPAAVEVDALAKSYGEVEAVRGVSFTVARGEVFGFLGPNGAGKSTTINMLCTLARPTSGTARVAGFERRAASLRVVPGTTRKGRVAVPDTTRGSVGRRERLKARQRLWRGAAERGRIAVQTMGRLERASRGDSVS